MEGGRNHGEIKNERMDFRALPDATQKRTHTHTDFNRAFAIGIGLNRAFVLLEAGFGLVSGGLFYIRWANPKGTLCSCRPRVQRLSRSTRAKRPGEKEPMRISPG